MGVGGWPGGLVRLRRHSIGLTALAATLTAQSVDRHGHLAAARPDAHTAALAGALNNLSSRLAALGRREDALAASAVASSREDQCVAPYWVGGSVRVSSSTPSRSASGSGDG